MTCATRCVAFSVWYLTFCLLYHGDRFYLFHSVYTWRKLRCRNSGSFPGSHVKNQNQAVQSSGFKCLSLKRMATGLWEKTWHLFIAKLILGGGIFFFWFVFRKLHPETWSGPRTLGWGVRILAKDTCRVSWVVEGMAVARERPDHQSPPPCPIPTPCCLPGQESSRMKDPQRFRTLHFHPPGPLGMPFWGES